ncbi:NuoM family protein [Ferruginibacter yonginensis]|uniref:NuoM family protein n=1 Tax=Ferruginibacter yonginensis TaxID=1310416 RepID=A0ABV8QTJ0_9BACT
MGTYITFPELLLWLPLLTAILCFFAKSESMAKSIALLGSLLVLGVSLSSLCYTGDAYRTYNAVNYLWLQNIGASFYITLEGAGKILTLLTAIAFPIIFIATNKNSYKNAAAFFGLMLLSECGLMGVFLAKDALLFYFFWELALIPVYFLCSKWGAEKRVQATFKFFVYTFAGSLLMLTGIIYVYLHTTPRFFEDGSQSMHSFAMQSFYTASLTAGAQNWLFWLFFVAFAIKMPIFPFHTWQPDTYDQSPTSVTMVLSGIMVKMGLFGVIKWLIPIVPLASEKYACVVIILSVIGIIYASCIAMVQDNLKKLVAYSSIAHIGLMCAAIFTMNEVGLQGIMIQMFSHGINIIGLWIVIDVIEKQTGTKSLSQLGGIAHKAPVLTILLVIIAFANIALPLTNAFVGEFMMFAGLYKYSVWLAAVAGLSIILAAVYTLNMVQKVFYGSTNTVTEQVVDINWGTKVGLSLIVVMIFIFGVFPQPMIDLTKIVVSGLAR